MTRALKVIVFFTTNNLTIFFFSNKFSATTVCLSAETQIQHEENGCHSCSPTGNLPRSHLQTSPRRNKKNLPSKRNGHFGFHGWIRLAIYQRPICRHSPSRRGRQGRRPCKAPLQCGPNQNLAESPFLYDGTLPREPRDCLK